MVHVARRRSGKLQVVLSTLPIQPAFIPSAQSDRAVNKCAVSPPDSSIASRALNQTSSMTEDDMRYLVIGLAMASTVCVGFVASADAKPTGSSTVVLAGTGGNTLKKTSGAGTIATRTVPASRARQSDSGGFTAGNGRSGRQ